MGINIDCKGKTILKIKNIVFGGLHERICLTIEKEKFSKLLILNKFLERTDQTIYGAGGIGLVDIADYFKTKHDVLLFASLVKEALEEEQKSEYPFSQEAYERLFNFHQELLNYATTLEE